MIPALVASIDPADPATWRDRIFVTLDVDWAPDDVLEYAIRTLRQRGLRCTIFATHASPVLEALNGDDQFEIGLHPNYNHLLAASDAAVTGVDVDVLKNWFPAARSVRSHSLVQSSRLHNHFVRHGLTHECNTYIPHDSSVGVRPWRLWNGLIKVPFIFADDVHLYGGAAERPVEGLFQADLCVVAFHPIHLFLNTASLAAYQEYKTGTAAGQPVDRFVNRTAYGVRDVFDAMLESV